MNWSLIIKSLSGTTDRVFYFCFHFRWLIDDGVGCDDVAGLLQRQVKIGNYIIHFPSVRPQMSVFDCVRHVNQWWICTSPSNSLSKTDNYYFRISHVSHGSETEETKIHHLRILMRTYTGKKLDPSSMRFRDNDSCSPSVSLEWKGRRAQRRRRQKKIRR